MIFFFFFFVSLARAGIWLLFNALSALLFSLFYVIREFDRFLHRGRANVRGISDFFFSIIVLTPNYAGRNLRLPFF